MGFFDEQREFMNNQHLFNIEELLKIIANQQQQIIEILKENRKLKENPVSGTKKKK